MDKIAVIDFGGQYAHLIATRIRRLGVYSEIFSEEASVDDLRDFKGVILSGGPQSVYDEDSPRCDKAIFEMNIPVLGICYGHQYMNYSLGGEVKPGTTKEYGLANVALNSESPLFKNFVEEKEAGKYQMWMSHGDEVSRLAEGFTVIGETSDCAFAAATDSERKLYGVQFHPEVTHSLQGNKLLENFVFEICGAEKGWAFDENFVEEKIEELKSKIGDKKVFLLVSGGVDSTVAFAMIARAIGNEKVYGLFVDTGFMRENERDEVEAALKKIGVNLHVYDKHDTFFDRLDGVWEPEKKRVIIGDTFLDVKDEVADELNLLGGDWILGQGTIYPDTIESGGTKRADKIKTHHNRVDKIQELMKQGKLVEPLADLYKDEVRKIGEILGLSKELVWRHPFPGPGLAVRCLCIGDAPEFADGERIAGEIMGEFGTSVDGAAILPVKSVGVQGDARSYRHAAILSKKIDDIDNISDFWEEMSEVSPSITNKFKEVNRVLLGISPDKIEEMEAIPHSYLTPERVSILQKADHVITSLLHEFEVYSEIWQFPVVIVPVRINGADGETIILRPVLSTEAMTAEFGRLSKDFLLKAKEELMKVEGVGAVLYDITNKPPGTIEWE